MIDPIYFDYDYDGLRLTIEAEPGILRISSNIPWLPVEELSFDEYPDLLLDLLYPWGMSWGVWRHENVGKFASAYLQSVGVA